MNKRISKKVTALVLSLIFLTSCEGGVSNSSISSEDNSEETSQITSTNTSIEELSTSSVSHGTAGGFLIDIAVHRFLADNSSYSCTFRVNNSDPTMTFKSSNENVVSLKKDEKSADAFNILTHNIGDAIISIYDIDGVLSYREVVKVRKGYDEESIKQAVYDFDIYKGLSMMGNHRLNFTSISPFEGQVSGSDDYESNMNITFSATYSEYISEWDMYAYNLEIIDSGDSTTKLTQICISRCGDNVLLYYSNGLLNMFWPTSLAYLHEGAI